MNHPGICARFSWSASPHIGSQVWLLLECLIGIWYRASSCRRYRPHSQCIHVIVHSKYLHHSKEGSGLTHVSFQAVSYIFYWWKHLHERQRPQHSLCKSTCPTLILGILWKAIANCQLSHTKWENLKLKEDIFKALLACLLYYPLLPLWYF